MKMKMPLYRINYSITAYGYSEPIEATDPDQARALWEAGKWAMEYEGPEQEPEFEDAQLIIGDEEPDEKDDD